MDFNKGNARAIDEELVSTIARTGDVEPLIALAKQSVASGILGLGISIEIHDPKSVLGRVVSRCE